MRTTPVRTLQLGLTRSSCRGVLPSRRRVPRCLKCRSLDDDDSSKVDIDELAKLLSSKAAELRQNNAEPASTPPAEVSTGESTSPVCTSAVHDAALLHQSLEAEFGEGGFCADDFELIQHLGNLSVQLPDGSAEQTTLVVAFIARCSSGMPYSSPAPILLKEYLPQGRHVGINELRVLTRLDRLPPDKWLAATQLPPTPNPSPVIAPVGYFLSSPSPKAAPLLPPTLPPTEECLWLVYRFLPLRPLSSYIEAGPPRPPQKAPLAFWQSQDAMEGRSLMARWRMLKALSKASLEALAACHEGGVAHGAVSSGCLLLNTLDDEEAAGVAVKLDGFGFGKLIRSPDEGAEDVKALSLVFAELYTAGLREVQEGLGGAPPTRQALHNLLFGVFQEDVRRFREWCKEDPQYRRAVEFLDAEGALGWGFLQELMQARLTARQLLEHSFIVDA